MQSSNESNTLRQSGEVISTNAPQDEDEGQEEQPQPKLSDKERTLARIKQMKSEGIVFQSSGDNTEPDYTVFDIRGGLRQTGKF